MTKPALCPFCGGTDVVYDEDIESVLCQTCTATGPSMLKRKEQPEGSEVAAIEAWNKRLLARPSSTLRWAAARLSRFADDRSAVEELLLAAERIEKGVKV
jgi:Lar family restriction alleviation protein